MVHGTASGSCHALIRRHRLVIQSGILAASMAWLVGPEFSRRPHTSPAHGLSWHQTAPSPAVASGRYSELLTLKARRAAHAATAMATDTDKITSEAARTATCGLKRCA